jgi:general secretion pathway protein D
LLVKEYRVSPNLIPSTSPSESEGEPEAGQSSADSNKKLKGMKNATDYLKQQGIPFPPGAFANYVSSGSKLIVRNTQGALDLVDTLVESDVGVKPTQVEIESKFIEISQNNVNELGFDWLLGPFSIAGGVYGDGGTPGGDSTTSYNNFPFGQVPSPHSVFLPPNRPLRPGRPRTIHFPCTSPSHTTPLPPYHTSR